MPRGMIIMTTLKEAEEILPPKIFSDLKSAFREFDLTDAQKQKAIKQILEIYKHSCYEPGEAIGVVSAQSLSEPGTQMTMRTYHIAGAMQILTTLGLPRLIEIFDARRSPTTPSMTIYVMKSYGTKEKVIDIASNIKETKLSDISAECAVDIVNMHIEAKINEKAMKEVGLKIPKIVDALKEGLKNVSVQGRASSVIIKPKDEMTIKELQKLRAKTLAAHISGVKNIERIIIRQEEDEWIIETMGSNLADVLLVQGVDQIRTTTNNMHEVLKVLGVEAARQKIVEEADRVINEAEGLNVDVRHIMLVADVMTVDGEIRAIGRYGVAGAKGSVLARANFEETIKHLTKAAITSESDHLESVVENVMINQVVPVGTGMFDVVFKPKVKK